MKTQKELRENERPIGFKEACKVLSVSYHVLRRWIKEGKITAYGSGRKFLFFQGELLCEFKKLTHGR